MTDLPNFRQALHAEIKRLKDERALAERKKAEVVERIDNHITLLDERTDLAVRLADAYSRSYPKLSFVQRHPVIEQQTVERPLLAAAASLDQTSIAPVTVSPDANRPLPLDLTEAEWAKVRPLLAQSRGKDDRRQVTGILLHERHGVQWREIPAVLGGKWTTYYNRFGAWEKSGLWSKILRALGGGAQPGGTPQPSADFHRRDGPPTPPAQTPRRRAAINPELTRAEIEAVELPATIMGHQLRPKSGKARIIRGIIAVLRKEGWAPRWEIERALRQVGVINGSDGSANRLAVILSESKDLFDNCRLEGVGETGWYLRETEKEATDAETDT